MLGDGGGLSAGTANPANSNSSLTCTKEAHYSHCLSITPTAERIHVFFIEAILLDLRVGKNFSKTCFQDSQREDQIEA